MCHGYRDDLQLRIYDETQELQQKFLVQHSPKTLQYTIELEARDVFFAHFVLPGSRGWDFLVQMPPATPSYLTVSLKAVCLAFLAHRRTSSSLLSRARLEYSAALRIMNKELSSSNIDDKHHLLTSTMCLDLFEKLTNIGPGGKEFWLGHVNGSLALIQALGLDLLKDPLSLRLLARLVTNCTISCVASATVIPSALLEVRAHLEHHSDIGQCPKWKLSGLMVGYASLQSKIRNSACSPHEYSLLAVDLDLKLTELCQSMPDSWLPEIQEPDRFPRKEVYPSRHVTQAWNTVRLVRILLHEFLLQNHQRAMKDKFAAEDEASVLSIDEIATLGKEVCSSVLQYTDGGNDSQSRSKGAISSERSVSFGDSVDSSQALNCYTIMFPLYIVARSKWTKQHQKAWVIDQLKHIGKNHDIYRAFDLVQLVQEQAEIDPWHVYAMLGSYAFAA